MPEVPPALCHFFYFLDDDEDPNPKTSFRTQGLIGRLDSMRFQEIPISVPIRVQNFPVVDEIQQTDVTCPQYDAWHPFDSCPIASIRSRPICHHVAQERPQSQMDCEKALDTPPGFPSRQRSFAIMAKSCTAEDLSAQSGFLGPTYVPKIP